MFNGSFVAEAPHTRIWKDSREKSRHYQSLWQSFTEFNATQNEGKENKSNFFSWCLRKQFAVCEEFCSNLKSQIKNQILLKFPNSLKQCIKPENSCLLNCHD